MESEGGDKFEGLSPGLPCHGPGSLSDPVRRRPRRHGDGRSRGGGKWWGKNARSHFRSQFVQASVAQTWNSFYTVALLFENSLALPPFPITIRGM